MEQWKLVLAVGAVALSGFSLGAWVFGAGPARAQDAGYRECFVARQESVDTNDEGITLARPLSHRILVPEGYAPIGGGGLGSGSQGTVVFCRR